jgi:hypothetical protein
MCLCLKIYTVLEFPSFSFILIGTYGPADAKSQHANALYLCNSILISFTFDNIPVIHQ